MATRKKRNRKQSKRRIRRKRTRLAAEEQNARPSSPVQQEPSRPDWAGPDGNIGVYIGEESKRTLDAYRNQPNLIIKHAHHEEDTARGGYARRQLFELVQNGADALAGSNRGRISIRLTESHFYCADDGQPVDADGVRALMFSHLSPKRGTMEIGRFGLGFKSVLGVTDSPEFFSRSGSFRFDRRKARNLVQPIAPDSERYPVLRLPEAVDPWPEMESDPILREFMRWAVNIVRLPLKPGTHDNLDEQIREFPPEFLLFVEHVSQLVLETADQDESRTVTGRAWLENMHAGTQTYEQNTYRVITLRREDSRYVLDDGGTVSDWMLTKIIHPLSSDAKSDSRSLDDADEVPISWAAPIDQLNDPGRFWAFFPTMTTSLLAGILNAPWKTNEDRQNLLQGVYNDELIDAAAAMVAKALPRLSTEDDPARHLDALPRREEAGDSQHSNRLREQLYSILQDREIVPDQNGKLRRWRNVLYPPRELIQAGQAASASFARWAAYNGRPSNWLHHEALTRNRLARIGQFRLVIPTLRDSSIAQWLEALVKNAKSEETTVQASMAAIQTAVSIPKNIRDSNDLGKIVLTTELKLVNPESESIYLGDGDVSGPSGIVHPRLQADHDTLVSLKELGLTEASSETVSRDRFKSIASALLGYSDESGSAEDWRKFWQLAREVDQPVAIEIIQSHDGWRDLIHVRTIAGSWSYLFNTLLPGRIVPADGSRDSEVAIDPQFHEADLRLLRLLDVEDAPISDCELSSSQKENFTRSCRTKFTQRDLPRSPHWHMLNFYWRKTTSGPLDVLEALSDEGKALYTWELLALPSTYSQWSMRHDTQDIYPVLYCESPAIEILRQHGRIETTHGIRPLSDGLGDRPQDPAVLRTLLSHPQANLIRETFALNPDVIDLDVEPIGEDDPIPLVDVWPGLQPYLSAQKINLQLVRCNGFRKFGDISSDEDERDCIAKDGSIIVKRMDDDRYELAAILRELALHLSDDQVHDILSRWTPVDIKAARDAVQACTTDEERLLAAVGETELRLGLPQGLIAILEDGQGTLPGIQVAEAAIATFHTGALREYRHALGHLDPPKQWAGGHRAVEFVRSLGFGEEWAGKRKPQRDPFIEVDGPYSLPNLHPYQRRVVDNMRELLQFDRTTLERRGMVSMPTGSGKTRVAVQAIVETQFVRTPLQVAFSGSPTVMNCVNRQSRLGVKSGLVRVRRQHNFGFQECGRVSLAPCRRARCTWLSQLSRLFQPRYPDNPMSTSS